MKKTLMRVAIVAISGCWFSAVAAQQVVYPAKGQSADQQKKDESACHQWAVQHTGFDPTKAAAAAPPPSTTPTGVTPGAGARGAARGAVVGGIVGDAGAGAAAGAAAGRAQSRRQNTAQQQQQTQAQSSQQTAYAKARAACLEGRGYTVK